MADSDSKNLPSSSTSSASSTKGPSTEINNRSSHNHNHSNNAFSGLKGHFPNPPDATNPDPATLREQWRFAIRQYSRWYSQAWGTAILAGFSFFALGWIIKGSNPLPSLGGQASSAPDDEAANDDGKK